MRLRQTRAARAKPYDLPPAPSHRPKNDRRRHSMQPHAKESVATRATPASPATNFVDLAFSAGVANNTFLDMFRPTPAAHPKCVFGQSVGYLREFRRLGDIAWPAMSDMAQLWLNPDRSWLKLGRHRPKSVEFGQQSINLGTNSASPAKFGPESDKFDKFRAGFGFA